MKKKYKFEIESEIIDDDNILCPWMDAEIPPEKLHVIFTVVVKSKSVEEAKKNIKYLITGKFKDNWVGREL